MTDFEMLKKLIENHKMEVEKEDVGGEDNVAYLYYYSLQGKPQVVFVRDGGFLGTYIDETSTNYKDTYKGSNRIILNRQEAKELESIIEEKLYNDSGKKLETENKSKRLHSSLEKIFNEDIPNEKLDNFKNPLNSIKQKRDYKKKDKEENSLER